MSSSLDLQTLEQNCETLYNPSSPSSRIQAESFLNYYCPTFSIESGANSNNALDATHAHNSCATSPIESALFCRNILENSKNPYALMFATTRLRSLVESHFTTFSITEQHGLRTFVLQYIYQKPDLPPFILAAQAQLLAIITKLGWLQNEGFRTLLDSVQPFFQHGVDHRIIGVRILAAIATEMNILGSHNVLKNRKSAVGFRDTQLLPIFQVALDMLRAVLRCQLSGTDTEKLKEAILILIKACLGFDFIGTSYEESLDDVGSIQVPAAWRSVFEESGYLDILWECWKAFSAPVSALVMECLSQAASIRRSIFTDDNTRHSYVCHIMRETLWTMNTAAGQNKLQDVGNFHEFSRMLSRFKSTFRLAETCDYSEAEQWLTAIGEFTAQGFHSWKWSPNTIPYLLTFWNKTVSGLSSAKQETERLIERITVKLTRAFLKSCLECVYAVMDGEADDPLESEEALLPLLEMFADIARTKYSESGQIICTEFKDLLLKYQDLLQRATTGPGNPSRVPVSNDIKESLMVVQLQLTWIVYIMAACIGGRVMYQSTSEQDQMDGEFACEVLGFIHQLRISTTQMPLYISSPDAHLYIQSSIIYFYIQFRSSYIDEDTAKAGKVYIQLAARWGLNTPSQVLNVIMNSSLGNLRSSGNPAWRKQEDQLVFRTLKLFTTLSSGYSSVKFIRKLDTTKALLKNHSPSEFQFLNPKSRNPSSDMGQCRTIYYKMLSQILFSEDNVDADFWRFVKPWETILDQILVAFEGGGGLNEEDIQLTLLGVFKDLRGFVTSISNRKQFNLFHEWFFAAYSPIALRAIEIWPQSELAITVLRFWQEFATNKSSRVTFDSSSADGILLFRETSNILQTLGQNLLVRPLLNGDNRWLNKYKGTILFFNIMFVSLSGKYANFGVFKLYGDKALDRVLELFFQLITAIPIDDMISYPKLALAYFNAVNVFATDHMAGLPMMPHAVLSYIFQTMGEAIPLHSTDATCSTLACSATDKICTFVFNWLYRDKIRRHSGTDAEKIQGSSLNRDGLVNNVSQQNEGHVVSLSNDSRRYQQQSSHWLVEYVHTNKSMLSYIFMVLFQAVAFESRGNHWSLSRPLLGLILLNREFYAEYTVRFVRMQLLDRQELLQKAIDGLMEGIENNLTTANRDKFTTNVTAFRRECNQMTLIAINPDDIGQLL